MDLKILLVLLLFISLTACSKKENFQESLSTPSRTEQASRINTELGAGYLRRGNYELALQKLQKAIAYDPKNVQALSTLAILYEQINKTDSARQFHKLAIEANPEDASAQNNFGAFLCKIGEYKESEKHFMQAAVNPFYQTPELALVNAGRCAAKVPDYPSAERHLREALKFAPNNSEALFLLASIKYDMQEFMSARGFLQRYEAVAAPSRSSLVLGYRIETELNNLEQVEIYARKLESLYPGSTAILRDQTIL